MTTLALRREVVGYDFTMFLGDKTAGAEDDDNRIMGLKIDKGSSSSRGMDNVDRVLKLKATAPPVKLSPSTFAQDGDAPSESSERTRYIFRPGPLSRGRRSRR